MNINNPVFIVSSGRSGTTLLVKLLNGSNELCIPPESDFVTRCYNLFKSNKIQESEYTSLLLAFKITSQFEGWGLDDAYIMSELQENQPQTFKEVNDVLNKAYLKKHHRQHQNWGIKRPVLIANLDKIISTFPNAKIIHVIRDGRDVYLSYKSIHENAPQAFGPGSILTSVLYWVDGLRRIHDFVKKHPKQIYEIRYESLLKNTDVELSNLCQFLDIKYSPDMHSNLDPHISQSNSDSNYNVIHAKINQAIDKDNAEKYLNKMSFFSQILFELLSSPFLKKYTYKQRYPWTNSIFLAPFRLVLWFVARQYNNIRYWIREKKTYALITKQQNFKESNDK
jgi:hypothetical protein